MYDDGFLTVVESKTTGRVIAENVTSDESSLLVTKRPVDNGGEGGVDMCVDKGTSNGIATGGRCFFVRHDDKLWRMSFWRENFPFVFVILCLDDSDKWGSDADK
jgi:hypothetical protein